MKHDAYLVITEKPFITIVVGIFGVVFIHSSSAGWTKTETEKGQDLPLEKVQQK